jgi:GNAT superfamily N-acetyltransferase
MSAYRFCRTDDMALLVEALNRCWSPYFPGEPEITPAAFKRSIRDLQVWCSSCMVAFSGTDPIGVLIGAKRPSGTLVHRIAVHPEHRRQGHARHLLTSLASKLAILGPPRILAEVPETLAPVGELFKATGYVEEAILTDYVWQAEAEDEDAQELAGATACPEWAPRAGASGIGFVIPVTVDDLVANGLLGEAPPSADAPAGQLDPPVCWQRWAETFAARKDDIAGIAVASEERIEAYLLYVQCGPGIERTAEILSLRTLVEDDGARLAQLLAHLRAGGTSTVRFPKVHPVEVSKACLGALGFRPAGVHRLYAATARGN